MLNALRKIQSGEITTSIYHKGVWNAADNNAATSATAARRNDDDMLHTQIGIAIGYGYVIGTVSIDGDRVNYTQLTLTSKGHEFLATMQSSPSVTEMPVKMQPKKLLAGVVFIAGVALMLFLAFVFVPQV